MAHGHLNLDYQEYCDITLFEITALIEGYNMRWEEKWRHTRSIYSLLYNINAPKGKGKSEVELMPFPSEYKLVKLKKEVKKRRELAQLEKHLKGETEKTRTQR